MDQLKSLLELMFKHKASDLILTTGASPQLRINGIIEPIKNQKVLMGDDAEKLLFPILTDNQRERFIKDKELDMSFGIEGLSRFRLNAYYQRGSVSVAIRLIPYEIPSIDSLGLPPMAKEFIEKPNGLILVTGPTGSGKSTTLASFVEYINQRRACHIITIEDPIEFLHSHKKSIIDQREVGSDTLSFNEALRHVLRETPDVIMIGEMRDMDTIRTALTLAETGHLILTTLHTHSAAHAISRIIDVFPADQQQQARVQLASVLLGVIVQELILEKDKEALILATEVMNVTGAIKHLIRENNVHQIYTAIQTGSEAGMVTLNRSLCNLVKEGLINREVAMLRSNDQKELENLLSQHGA